MKEDDVRLRVCEIISRYTSIGKDELPLTVPIFSSGIGLDSVTAIRLVLDIEAAFNIFFDDSELSVEEFSSIKDVSRMIVTKLHQENGAAT